MEGLVEQNAEIWEKIYASGHRMNYPDDGFTKAFNDLVKNKVPVGSKVLDYGFGSGVIALHIARSGFQVSGVELSQSAINTTQARLAEEGYQADLRLNTEKKLPFEDNTFDVVVAWQSLYYGNHKTIQNNINEFKRVLKNGGIFLAAMTMPGSQLDLISIAENDGFGTKIIQNGNQTTARVCVPTKEELYHLFNGVDLHVGSLVYDYDSLGMTQNSFWIISFTLNK
jgi:ubiquinone/menaquinone biosynthesis C-methylase UbiE